MSKIRNNRLSGEVRKVISEIIQTQLKDPRISDLTSVTDVHVTEDLKYTKIYISVYGDIDSTFEALQSAKGFIRRELGKKVKMRIVPELIFEKDDSIERGIYMSKLIDQVINSEAGEKHENETE